ncbi:ferredoxin [Desulfohalotomaculum tongense]|uniref:NIL domain-containing protein n=1 Tax=Desulforadius tongensis TaxID=1216062 RepID=UPI00195D2D3F|nr:NIL domain-containing protein [Desulforadius tongensis]MBM7855397.1 ferredoxin [Desulforadius tongensis]
MPSKKIILRFSPETSDKPIIYHLVKDFDLVVNIIKAHINPDKEGTLVLELTGERYEEGINFLKEQKITVQRLAEQINYHKERCTSCGCCTDSCPTGALYLQRPSMQVNFDGDKCIVCQMCVKVCPMKAMEVCF